MITVGNLDSGRDFSDVRDVVAAYVLLLVRGGLRPIWVSNVTQVPAVVGMVAESFGQVFPAPPRPGRPAPRRSLTHLLVARQIMQHHRHVFGVGP